MKKENAYNQESIEIAQLIERSLTQSQYVKIEFVRDYLLTYRGYSEYDVEELQEEFCYIHTSDLKRFLDETHPKHQAYLKSLKWKELRDYVRERDNYICSSCGGNFADNLQKLHTHHLTYERLGDERPEDLVLLCEKCHNQTHREEKTHE